MTTVLLSPSSPPLAPSCRPRLFRFLSRPQLLKHGHSLLTDVKEVVARVALLPLS